MNTKKRVAITRKESFNAAHRIFNSSWTDEKNKEVFGKCSNPNYHGHNYDLYVRLVGEVNPETGYVFDLKILGDLIKKYVTELIDHKNLNLDVEGFSNTIPTTENLAIFIYEQLRPHIEEKIEMSVKLYETEKNFVEYPV